MMIGVVAVAIFALIILFCVRHFFVQLVAIKLLVDCLVLIAAAVRGVSQAPYNGESTSVMIGSLGLLIFFVLLATRIKKYAGEES